MTAIMLQIYNEKLYRCTQRIVRTNNINLKKAFVEAGIPTSTFYRAMYGQDAKLI